MRLVEAVKIISEMRGSRVAIATMSAMTSWAEMSTSDADLCYFAPMGSASSMGLGLALARPDIHVIVLDGDGCLLMNLGSLVTIANQRPPNLVHFVFENGCYALSGLQPLPSKATTTSLSNMARAAGIPHVYEISSADVLAEQIDEILHATGPVFVSLQVEAEFPQHMDRMVTSSHRERTAKEGWHRLHALLSDQSP